jgi:hypothetical protein
MDNAQIKPMDPHVWANMRFEDIQTAPLLTGAQKKRERRVATQYAMIPEDWQLRLASVGAHTYKTAVRVIVEWYKSGKRPFKLSNVDVARFGVTIKGKRRALVELEALGLITVERSSGRAPLVAVIGPVPWRDR